MSNAIVAAANLAAAQAEMTAAHTRFLAAQRVFEAAEAAFEDALHPLTRALRTLTLTGGLPLNDIPADVPFTIIDIQHLRRRGVLVTIQDDLPHIRYVAFDESVGCEMNFLRVLMTAPAPALAAFRDLSTWMAESLPSL